MRQFFGFCSALLLFLAALIPFLHQASSSTTRPTPAEPPVQVKKTAAPAPTPAYQPHVVVTPCKPTSCR